MTGTRPDARPLVAAGAAALVALLWLELFGPGVAPLAVMGALAGLLVLAAAGAALDVLARARP